MLRAVAILAAFIAATCHAEQRPRIAIIIDDLGYEYTHGLRATALPGPVACAVLPGTPRGTELAEAAYREGKEVLLHLPLQAVVEDDRDEPGGIVLDMSRGQFAHAFALHISSIPHVIGVNTHRGSLLTRHPGHMQWLMEEISARNNLFFIDSYTTHESVALELARESGIPALKRDVFLDPDRSAETVAREFERLKKLAKERGAAIAIGHPYAETMNLLERELPRLRDDGFELVSLRQLLGEPNAENRIYKEAVNEESIAATWN